MPALRPRRCLALLVLLVTGCADDAAPDPVTVEGVSPAAPDTVAAGDALAPEAQMAPAGDLAPDATLAP